MTTVSETPNKPVVSRKASAQWSGDVMSGKGQISLESQLLKDAQYGFASRFEQGNGTNPEELLASAHAGCFTMQLSALLSKAGHQPEKLETNATCDVIKEGEGFKVKSIHLEVIGKVSNISKEQFSEYIEEAAKICPLSKAISGNVEISHITTFSN